jgi:UDP-N-acetylenolpyruvoylglucosamine reductase, C-terminal domain
VHALQPLVLINVDHATGEEVAKLAEAIRTDVETKFGILISPEVLYI